MSTAIVRSPPLQVERLEDRCLLSSSAFVSALYQGILHRAPSAGEVTGWVDVLNSGVSPSEVALSFTTSQEYQANLITTDYQFFLGRQPSAAEIGGWQAALQGGLGENQLQAAFLGSNEFFVDHASAINSWVDAVYKHVLGRPAEAAGLAVWSAQLQAGTPRETVALDILLSPEALSRFVTAAYQDLLGRAPDPAGLAVWVAQLQQGLAPSEFLADIASSPEFIALAGGLDTVNPGTPTPVITPIDGFVEPFVGPVVVIGAGCGCTTAGFTGGFTGGFSGTGTG
jgi:hypothetical protein